MQKKTNELKFGHLRQNALELLSEYQQKIPAVFDDKMRKLFLEMEINRDELELQNEESTKRQPGVRELYLKFRQLYELAPIGYLTLDRDDCIIEINKRAAQMLSLDKKQLIGQKFFNFIQFDHQDVFFLHQRHLKKFGERLSCSLYLRTASGTESRDHGCQEEGRRYVQLESIPKVDIDGKLEETLMIMTDTSVLHQSNTAVIALNQELEERNKLQTDKLELAEKHLLHREKMATIGSLAASIAHELTNPLQAIMTIIQGIDKRVVLEEEDTEMVKMAVSECKRMAHLLNSLRDFNRPSSGTRAPLHLPGILESLLLLFKKELAIKNIAVDSHLNNPLPVLFGVNDQIKQVAMNLLKNSVDACSEGGKVSLGTKSQKNSVILEISDNGVGIDPSIMPHIFEPFFSTKSEATGSGLGLSVCYGIIKSHNGTIEVKSIPNKKTTFRVTLPVRGPDRKPNYLA